MVWADLHGQGLGTRLTVLHLIRHAFRQQRSGSLVQFSALHNAGVLP